MDSRRIVLTGVSRGLGLAMTRGFAEAGHTVIGCARNAEAIANLAVELPKPHRFDVVDVAQEADVRGWAGSVVADHGPPDLLVNNAALINENTELWNVDPDEFSQLIDVNVKGVFHVIRHFLPSMIERGTGIVANFSSGWGRSTSPEVAPYCASKWAIEGLTGALARELPRDLAAVAVNPGIIDTDMLKSCFGSASSGYPTAEQWAHRAVPFLLQLNRKHNGESVSV